MMGDIMQFPETVEEFMQQYKITDTQQVYTNGTELVPIFRMKQWVEAHKQRWIPCSERLPNPGERVLATDGGFVGEMYIGKRGEWRRYNVTYIEDLMALDILWWMPLPEPPEEEQ